KHYGFRTINVVRRREAAEELRRLGGDAASPTVICTADESIPERVRAITGGAGVRHAIDAGGGSTAVAVVQALGPGGRLLLYGTLSQEPLLLDPRSLMAGQKTVEGFWLSEWVEGRGLLAMFLLFRTLGRLLQAGVFPAEPTSSYPMTEIQEAVRQAEAP